MSYPVIFLMGATATGKTSLAVDLCAQFPMDVISVDSAMVYKGMDIGTAKPGPEILAHTPHRLIDICDPAEAYSAARFREDAIAAINEIHAKQRIPLLVGGTGLYFRTLETGISELPEARPEIRSAIEQEATQSGWQAIHQHLAAIDPVSAKRIHPNDPQRIQRAMEVYLQTGLPLSEHYSMQSARALPNPVIKIILHADDRNILHKRVKIRFLQMLEDGLVEEVKRFHQRKDLHAGLPAMRMVGYRQVWKYLEDDLSYNEMTRHAIVATRQLAKRQITWLRKEENARWFDSENSELLREVSDFFRKNTYLCDKM